MTLLTAENFLVLKLYEVWKELQWDLKLTKNKPVPVDEKMLEIVTEHLEKHSDCVRKEQIRMKKEEKQFRELQKNKHYNFLRESELQYGMDALRELSYVARIADKLFMLDEKNLQRRDVLGKLAYKSEPRRNTFRHYIFADHLKITEVFHQDIHMDYRFEFNENPNATK